MSLYLNPYGTISATNGDTYNYENYNINTIHIFTHFLCVKYSHIF